MVLAQALHSNKFFNKALFNKLQANTIKATKILQPKKSCACNDGISFLFSLDISSANWDGSTLSFKKEDIPSLIVFTDRPYKLNKHFVGDEAENYLDILFLENSEGFQSFEKDLPNGVLSTSFGQEAYEIKLKTVQKGEVKMILNLLENQNNLKNFSNEKVTLFISNQHYNKCKKNNLNKFINLTKFLTYLPSPAGKVIDLFRTTEGQICQTTFLTCSKISPTYFLQYLPAPPGKILIANRTKGNALCQLTEAMGPY